MTVIEFIAEQFQRLHGRMEDALDGLNSDQLHWCPGDSSNHIAFNIWHCARTEDNVVSIVLSRNPPPIWLGEGWHEKFGGDPRSNGTGMSHEEAVGVRMPDGGDFMLYMRQVWERTEEYLKSLGGDESRRVQEGGYKGDLVIDILYDLLVSHGERHLGEIWTTRGLQGMGRGSPV